jgi:hypothetical protein
MKVDDNVDVDGEHTLCRSFLFVLKLSKDNTILSLLNFNTKKKICESVCSQCNEHPGSKFIFIRTKKVCFYYKR